MAACLTNDIRPKISKVGEFGVKTAFIAFEKDSLIPPNDQIADSVEVYDVIPGVRHSAPQFKAGQVADKIIDTVRELHAA
jgi:hypothetical protein